MKLNLDLKHYVKTIIFYSKWLVIPFLIKLFFTLGILLYHFILENHISNEDLMSTLEAVDTVMVASLVNLFCNFLIYLDIYNKDKLWIIKNVITI
jgi:uncharacterized membrane protein YqhA